MPCLDTIAVQTSLHVDPFQACHLHNMWHLKNHPCFRQALKNRSLSAVEHGLPVEESCVAVAAAAPKVTRAPIDFSDTFTVAREAYDMVKYPSDLHRRYAILNATAMEVVRLGQMSEHHFKLAQVGLTAIVGKIAYSMPAQAEQRNNLLANVTAGDVVGEPQQKKAKANESVVVQVFHQFPHTISSVSAYRTTVSAY